MDYKDIFCIQLTIVYWFQIGLANTNTYSMRLGNTTSIGADRHHSAISSSTDDIPSDNSIRVDISISDRTSKDIIPTAASTLSYVSSYTDSAMLKDEHFVSDQLPSISSSRIQEYSTDIHLLSSSYPTMLFQKISSKTQPLSQSQRFVYSTQPLDANVFSKSPDILSETPPLSQSHRLVYSTQPLDANVFSRSPDIASETPPLNKPLVYSAQQVDTDVISKSSQEASEIQHLGKSQGLAYSTQLVDARVFSTYPDITSDTAQLSQTQLSYLAQPVASFIISDRDIDNSDNTLKTTFGVVATKVIPSDDNPVSQQMGSMSVMPDNNIKEEQIHLLDTPFKTIDNMSESMTNPTEQLLDTLGQTRSSTSHLFTTTMHSPVSNNSVIEDSPGIPQESGIIDITSLNAINAHTSTQLTVERELISTSFPTSSFVTPTLSATIVPMQNHNASQIEDVIKSAANLGESIPNIMSSSSSHVLQHITSDLLASVDLQSSTLSPYSGSPTPSVHVLDVISTLHTLIDSANTIISSEVTSTIALESSSQYTSVLTQKMTILSSFISSVGAPVPVTTLKQVISNDLHILNATTLLLLESTVPTDYTIVATATTSTKSSFFASESTSSVVSRADPTTPSLMETSHGPTTKSNVSEEPKSKAVTKNYGSSTRGKYVSTMHHKSTPNPLADVENSFTKQIMTYGKSSVTQIPITTGYKKPKYNTKHSFSHHPITRTTLLPSHTRTGKPTHKPIKPSLYITIIMKLTWSEFCLKVPLFIAVMTKMVDLGLQKPIKTEQVKIMNNKYCDELSEKLRVSKSRKLSFVRNTGPDKLSIRKRDASAGISIDLYVTDQKGGYSYELTTVLANSISAEFDGKTKSIDGIGLVIGYKVHGKLKMSHSQQAVQKHMSDGVIVAITLACIAGVCFVGLIVLQILFKRRRGKKMVRTYDYEGGDAHSTHSVESIHLTTFNHSNRAANHLGYTNEALDLGLEVLSRPLDYQELETFADNWEGITDEYQLLPNNMPKLSEVPLGAEDKNRYANVIPVRSTRVHLSDTGEEHSQYINANYVRGYADEARSYIATQAPLEDTVNDFWRMVWEQQSQVIIMLTDLEEHGLSKCAPYWPDVDPEGTDTLQLYGDYEVVLKAREEKSDCIISTFSLKDIEKNLCRYVTHFWYTSWPIHGVPDSATSVLKFLVDVRPFMEESHGPPVVHCSPGTGRTGTLIAVDICMRQFEETQTVDVLNTVNTIREDRAGSVQTLHQYAFIYKALATYCNMLRYSSTVSLSSSIASSSYA